MSWVLFYDGDCAFCSASVRAVVCFDKNRRISFAPLQGERAGELGFSRYADPAGGTMVLLRESDGRVFTHGASWIQLARALGGGWRIFTLARFIPEPLLDFVYRGIARNRHHFMGNADTCPLPAPDVWVRLGVDAKD